MKKLTFIKKIILFIWSMYALLAAVGVAFARMQFLREDLKYSDKLRIILAVFVFAALLYLAIMKWVIKPYVQYKNLFQKFTDGQLYQEVLDRTPFFMEEMGAVILRFNELVDWNKTIQLSTKQAEFLALQNQINPHFLYNTLDAIRGDALCAGMENIANITEALSTFFRYTITETGNLVTLMDELSNVEDYFTIQQYRFGEKLKLVIEMGEEADHIMQLQCPKLMLQPIVENSIFHGLEKKADGGTVCIEFVLSTERVLIHIRDDGVGMEEETVTKINKKLEGLSFDNMEEDKKRKGGIALNNVCRRIKLLFGEEYGIHVYSLENAGTNVCITLPVIRKKMGR
ncbi:MAG: sensor histidine kinase [Velocimicrobium sp.]